MKIINGKWADCNGEPITVFNYDKLKQIGEKVQAVYGKDITYDRINVISSLSTLSSKEENTLARVFDENILTKLMGY
tara:strand:- start:539 stop:769 length:231 start_codon:yes stop_codon:yes gene_type:complete